MATSAGIARNSYCRLRFSIAAAMGIVLFAAVAIAALASPTPYWVDGLFSATIVALIISFIRTLYASGQTRAFWMGFVIAGSCYLALASCPFFDGWTGSQFITSRIARWIYINKLSYEPYYYDETVWAKQLTGFVEGRINSIGKPSDDYPFEVAENNVLVFESSKNLRNIGIKDYQLLFNTIFGIFIGVLGAVTARLSFSSSEHIKSRSQ